MKCLHSPSVGTVQAFFVGERGKSPQRQAVYVLLNCISVISFSLLPCLQRYACPRQALRLEDPLRSAAPLGIVPAEQFDKLSAASGRGQFRD